MQKQLTSNNRYKPTCVNNEMFLKKRLDSRRETGYNVGILFIAIDKILLNRDKVLYNLNLYVHTLYT